MTDEPIKYMDLDEFADAGFLQEANRLFFHPLGLALEVSDADQDNHYDRLRIWDYRDDPEGITFTPGTLSAEKKARVDLERSRHAAARTKMLDSIMQGIDKHEPLLKPPLRPGDRVKIVDHLLYGEEDTETFPPVPMTLEVLPHGRRMKVVEVDGQPVEQPYLAPNGLPTEYDVPTTRRHWDQLVKLIQIERVPKAAS